MKSTIINRKVDHIGRIYIPLEIRIKLGISDKDFIEFFIEEDKIILRKFIVKHQML